MPTAQLARRSKPRQRKPYHVYDVDQTAMILAALDANGGNVLFTAEQFGINESTLRGLRQQAQRDTARAQRIRDLRDEKKGDIVPVIRDALWESLQQIRDRLPEASSRDASVSFGILNQNLHLIQGLPTAIVGQSDPRLAALDDSELDEVLAILERAEQRRLSPPVTTVTVDAPALSATSAPDTQPLPEVPHGADPH